MTDVPHSPLVGKGSIANFQYFSWLLIVLLTLQFSQTAVASDQNEASPLPGTPRNLPSTAAQTPKFLNIQLGILGYWKLGYPVQALVTVAAGAEGLHGKLELESVDSDGVGVIYQTDCQIECGATKSYMIMTQHGRANRPMRVRILDSNGRQVVEHLISESERGMVLPVSQPWIVGIGSRMDLEQAALRSAKGLLPSYSTCEVDDAGGLPRVAAGYGGVDLLVISTREWTILEGLAEEQQHAIVDWVRGGGHVLIWLGENAERVRELPWLASLIRAQVEGIAERIDPVVLESFLSSQKRLDPLTCSRLVPDQCLVDLSLQSIDRKKLPVIFRSALGFGQIQVCAMDLDASPLREWSERKLLLERLYSEHFDALRDTRSKALDQANYLGYDDLSGQIHAALDRFEDVRTGSLAMIALILTGAVVLLGPFDYFIVSKTWKKPAWTWFSLVLWSLSTLVGVTLLAQIWKPRHHSVNSIELVDVDYSASMLRGLVVAHHYAGQAGRFNFSAVARSTLPISKYESDVRRSVFANLSIRPALMWSGQPGYGLGGFDSDVRTDIGFPTYRVNKNRRPSDSAERGMLRDDGTDLIDIGIAFAGSKSMRADWSSSLELPADGTRLNVTGVSELLQGTWTNPMNEDLLDGWLLYRTWLYPLSSRIRPNGIVQISASDVPKDLGRRLQRRQFVQDRDSSIPWDPTDKKDFSRLVEMLTLHQAAGGSGYTGLNHRYWNEWDLSKHLKMNRAIVFGRLEKPVVEWSANAGAEPLDIQDGKRWTFARFVIPVAIAK